MRRAVGEAWAWVGGRRLLVVEFVGVGRHVPGHILIQHEVGQANMASVPSALMASAGLGYSASGYWMAMSPAIRRETCSVDTIIAL